MEKKKGSLKSTIAVSLTNYLDAGAIVAGASGLTLWKEYLGLTEGHLGWLNAISANCLGAAIGAIIGGFLADKFGRKAIYTYNMLVYMLGVALIMFSFNFPMLLMGFLITGISVGVGVPASWTYISESSEVGNRGRNIGISQMAWGIGPTIILILGTLLAPPTGGAGSEGMLFGVVQGVASLFGVEGSGASLNVFSSRIVFASLFIVALRVESLGRPQVGRPGQEPGHLFLVWLALHQPHQRAYDALPRRYVSHLEPGEFGDGLLPTAYLRDRRRPL